MKFYFIHKEKTNDVRIVHFAANIEAARAKLKVEKPAEYRLMTEEEVAKYRKSQS